ncbi:hypothetical protein EIN_488080 [Entamoeba invadens IP1]|uniref:Ubiquitin-related modifier 1 homolog n=1 Tax=Entamoeba invadens IP1 TaxID=370355 RepID=A0A0A1U4V9_ENTIV|nr:hypothetical protein EIN_488080 [Entamoeba invadens IP1]ELP89286.1 hypothetical protein EIN_488080 [Entamoeba invadens IP1]|eukprot:XP_004256057.1 hypothetical protein EIN_488080 [Entamoeba invadens IP1]
MIQLELSGGLEYEAGTNKTEFPSEGIHTIKDVFLLIQKTYPKLGAIFQDSTVIPGIIVLINDADWELVGLSEAEVSDGDVVSLISSIHGG